MKLPSPASILPHRGRFLLLDRLERFDGDEIEAAGGFTIGEVEGHFPGCPVVPGVLLLEGLAQTLACADLLRRDNADCRPMLVGFDRVRFRAPVLPPVEVRYVVKLREPRFGIAQASGTVLVAGKRVCTAQLMGTMRPSTS